jgi:hypothetical protein
MSRAAQRPQAEDGERHQRLPLPGLDQQEGDQQHERTGDQQQRLRRSPADIDGVDDRVDEQRQARGDGDRARQIKRVGVVVGAALDQRPGRQRCRCEADRDVDKQNPAPVQAAGQDAAEQHAGRAPGAGDGSQDAERSVALGALGEGGGDDRQGGR